MLLLRSEKRFISLTRERQGAKKGRAGGESKLTRRPPTENSFRPPHLGTFPPSVNNTSADPLRNRFRRVSNNGFQGAILTRFCSSVRFPLPRLARPGYAFEQHCREVSQSGVCDFKSLATCNPEHLACV